MADDGDKMSCTIDLLAPVKGTLKWTAMLWASLGNAGHAWAKVETDSLVGHLGDYIFISK